MVHKNNTGNWNTGGWNTGHCNTGNRNTGGWNTGDRNTGYCNSITPDDCLIFNKPAKHSDWDNAQIPNWMHVSLTSWIYESDMSDEEKEAYPSYVTTGGYLKCYPNLYTAFLDSWNNTTQEDRELTYKLPNYCPIEFRKVFGFNPEKDIKKKITIDGKDIYVSRESFNELKKQLCEV